MANAYVEGLLARLAGRDPLEVLEATPARLERTVRDLGDRLDRPWAPAKWTGKQVVAHLADTEIAYGFRFRQLLAENGHRVQTFDQDAWATRYAEVDPALALAVFGAVRAWNLALLRRVSMGEWQHRAIHPERGEETLRHWAALLAGHDLNHLAQLERI